MGGGPQGHHPGHRPGGPRALAAMSHTICFPPQVLHSGKREASGVPGLEVVSMGKLEVGRLEGRQPT